MSCLLPILRVQAFAALKILIEAGIEVLGTSLEPFIDFVSMIVLECPGSVNFRTGQVVVFADSIYRPCSIIDQT